MRFSGFRAKSFEAVLSFSITGWQYYGMGCCVEDPKGNLPGVYSVAPV